MNPEGARVNHKSGPGEGTYFVLTRSDAKELFGLDGDEAVWQFVETFRSSPRHREDDLVLDCGTAWDPIHRILTDGTLSNDSGVFPDDHCVLGGRRMHAGLDFEVVMVRPDIVSVVANRLGEFKNTEFLEKYMGLDPQQYRQTPTETNGDTVWSMFELIRQLFENASKERAAVVFAVERKATTS